MTFGSEQTESVNAWFREQWGFLTLTRDPDPPAVVLRRVIAATGGPKAAVKALYWAAHRCLLQTVPAEAPHAQSAPLWKCCESACLCLLRQLLDSATCLVRLVAEAAESLPDVPDGTCLRCERAALLLWCVRAERALAALVGIERAARDVILADIFDQPVSRLL